MGCSSFAAILVSRRILRWLTLAGVIVVCLVVFVGVLRIRRENPAHMQVGGRVLTLHNFQTSSYSGDRMQLRVSGDLLTVSNLRLFGPLRLGFAYSLTIRNLTVETFLNTEPEPGSPTPSFNQALASLVPSLKSVLVSVVSQRIGGPIMSAEFGPLKVIQHTGDQERIIFEAAGCHTAKGLAKVICEDGMIFMNGKRVPFQKWQYDSIGTSLSSNNGAR